MKVVSNSPPLIFLSALGLLDVLRTEFGEVLIPEMVGASLFCMGNMGISSVKWGIDAEELSGIKYGE